MVGVTDRFDFACGKWLSLTMGVSDWTKTLLWKMKIVAFLGDLTEAIFH